MKRIIVLPNGRACCLSTYSSSWRTVKVLDPDAEVIGWEWYPLTAREILCDLHAGMHARINRHIPGFGRGRKWDDRYQLDQQRDARRVNDYAAHRLVDPVNRLTTPELQQRFQWHHGNDGLQITLRNRP